MINFCRTYTSFVPYLKGMHLTMDSWRELRDKDGWKIKKPQQSEYDYELYPSMEHDLGTLANCEPLDPLPLTHVKVRRRGAKQQLHPDELRPATRLKHDVEAFKSLLAQEQAPWIFVRGGRLGIVHYNFGDASQSGFVSSIGDFSGGLWF
mmetsp:Transcript_22242/g.31294  ORF Transcript_22242/g.31294 Transcript_22242/m.31294 type:complete len:150 (+) Transcript_22242:1287-1736(+)